MYKIYLFDIVDEQMLKEVRDHLEKAEEQGEDEIKVYINSPGGSVYNGLTIYNLFKERNVTTEVTGIAASMASYIACAGKKVTIQENSVIMIHKPWTFTAGNSDDMEKIQENLEMLEDIISSGYAKQSGMDQGKILDMMAEETWLTADDALKKGFVDKVIDDDEQNSMSYREYFNMVNMAHNKKGEDMDEILAWLKDTFNLKSEEPEEVLDELKGAVKDMKTETGSGKPETGEEKNTSTTENTEGTEKKIQNTEIDNPQMKVAMEKIEQLKSELDKMKQDKDEARVDNLIQNAINDGKILPAQKDVWTNSAKSDFAGTKKKLDAIPRNSVMPRGVKIDSKKSKEYEKMDMADYFRIHGEAGDRVRGGNNG